MKTNSAAIVESLSNEFIVETKRKDCVMNLLDSLAETVEKSDSFRRIMADGIVEDAEIEQQGKLVEDLIAKLEKQLSADDFALVSQLISELSVFHVIFNYR